MVALPTGSADRYVADRTEETHPHRLRMHRELRIRAQANPVPG